MRTYRIRWFPGDDPQTLRRMDVRAQSAAGAENTLAAVVAALFDRGDNALAFDYYEVPEDTPFPVELYVAKDLQEES